MNHKVMLAVLLSMCYVSTGRAFDAPSATVGWFFDEAGTQSCYSGQSFVPVTAYLCLRGTGQFACSAWELKTTISGDCAVLNWQLAGAAINILTPPEFAVGIRGTGLDQNEFGVVVLASARILPLDASVITIAVEQNSMPSIEGAMAYARYPDYQLAPIVSSSGSPDVPTSWVNSTCWPCNSANWSIPHVVHVKTAPGIVEIANPAGGDKVGNVIFNNAAVDSVVTEFQVDEVAKASRAWPDSVNYVVRVTGEPRISYMMRDLFDFALSDSNNAAAFVDAMSELDCVEWAYRAAAPQHFDAGYLSVPNDPCLGSHIVNPLGQDADFLHAWHMVDSVSSGDLVRVAIVDTGIDRTNLDLAGRVDPTLGYLGRTISHGTWVAGILGAVRDNGYAIAGSAPVMMIAEKFDTDLSEMSTALQSAMGHDAAIANVSGGQATEDFIAWENACAEFYNSNRIVVAAAGNGDIVARVSYPARYASCWAISGIAKNGELFRGLRGILWVKSDGRGTRIRYNSAGFQAFGRPLNLHRFQNRFAHEVAPLAA